MTEETFKLEDAGVESGVRRVRLGGRLDVGHSGELRGALGRYAGSPLCIDLSEVEEIDASAAAILADVWQPGSDRLTGVRFEGASARVGSVLALYTDRPARDCSRPTPERVGTLEHVGRATDGLLATLRQVLAFLGEALEAARKAFRNPSSVNWADVGRLIERHGADGVPIVILIGFLIGLITAFQAAIQLQKFGADVFVADLVSLSVTRELGPLMTAIVVAGRSGAAIAAEIGTMKVSEEIDAIRTLGLCPNRFLVFPRLLALVVALPFLTLLADFVGIAGGLVIATTQLDVTVYGFVTSVQEALGLSDVFGGLLKAMFFGFIIAAIGCERGLASRGGAEGVGRSTTSAVVAMLFHLIAADAIFTVLFQKLGL